MHYVLIGIGGSIGATLRYIVTMLFFTNQTLGFPFATVSVNLLGCFIVGLLSSGLEQKLKIEPKYMSAIKAGLIGSFTTFSTFSVEVIQLLQLNDYLSAAAYIFISAVFGLTFAVLGSHIGNRFTERRYSS